MTKFKFHFRDLTITGEAQETNNKLDPKTIENENVYKNGEYISDLSSYTHKITDDEKFFDFVDNLCIAFDNTQLFSDEVLSIHLSV